MKKIFTTLILGILLIGVGLAAQDGNSGNGNVGDDTSTTQICTDSDGGLNYYLFGSVPMNCGDTGVSCGIDSDYCLDDDNLVEYSCGGDWSITTEYECEHGCEDGACIVGSDTEQDEEEEDDGNPQSDTAQTVQERNRLRAYVEGESECADDCTCVGSVTRCELENGTRTLTIQAGKSGNIIVQTKEVNMTTDVVLYKSNGTLYGQFRGNITKELKVLPDQARERVKQRFGLNASEEIELNEDGNYQVRVMKRARLFGFIPVKERVEAHVSAQGGEVVSVRNPWWGWLASDVDEVSLG